MDRRDTYQAVTAKILAAIEAGRSSSSPTFPWRVDAKTLSPINISGARYRGINTLLLYIIAATAGFSSNIWATYSQWETRGAQVRKGEKSTQIIFWKPLTGTAAGDNQPSDQAGDNKSRRFVARSYSVFNASQVDGYSLPPFNPLNESERIDRADAFFQATGASIRHGGSRAYYSPTGDYIQMPVFPDFVESIGYYAVLAHELTHWTGAASRCDRQFSRRFGDKAYAFEELVAELGSAFLCASLGLTQEPRDDHASYLASWIEILKDDNRAIFTAASAAQTAVDWLMTRFMDDTNDDGQCDGL